VNGRLTLSGCENKAEWGVLSTGPPCGRGMSPSAVRLPPGRGRAEPVDEMPRFEESSPFFVPRYCYVLGGWMVSATLTSWGGSGPIGTVLLSLVNVPTLRSTSSSLGGQLLPIHAAMRRANQRGYGREPVIRMHPRSQREPRVAVGASSCGDTAVIGASGGTPCGRSLYASAGDWEGNCLETMRR
jgi:hypothetical protein